MRRHWMIAALAASSLVAGCAGSSRNPPPGGPGVQKGVVGQFFFVNINRPPVGGIVESDVGGIRCGASSVSVDTTSSPSTYAYEFYAGAAACGTNGQTSIPWFAADGSTPTTVTLTATAVQPADPAAPRSAFIGWAGDCSGTASTCTLTAGADRTVVAIFGPPGSGHGMPFPGAVHGPAFLDGTLNCLTCHGSAGQGQGIAPSCATCHASLRAPRTGLSFSVDSVTRTASGIVVQLRVTDDLGAPVDLTGSDGRNAPFVPRFGLASFAVDGTTGIVGPYQALTVGDATSGGPGVLTPPAVGAPASATAGELTGTPGSYTYRFPATVALDPTRATQPHTLWIQGSRQESPSAPTTRTLSVANTSFNFVPGALDIPVTVADARRREVVSAAACDACHDSFRPPGSPTGSVFHGGEWIDGTSCAFCHSPSNTRGDPATSDEGRRFGQWTGTAAQFVHVIHASGQMGMAASDLFFGATASTYPQPVANCTACHTAAAAQGAQWKTHPSVEACGSCHRSYPYPHATGACEGCHTPYAIEVSHVPVVRRDGTNSLQTPGGDSRTNAAALTGAGQIAPGASRLSAVIRDVTLTPDRRPVISFKLRKGDEVPTWTPSGMVYTVVTKDVLFNLPPGAPDASRELMADFVGTLGVYVVFSLPQDGIAAPADFNVAVSSNVKLAWMNVGGTAPDVATLSGPDEAGFYAVTFPNLAIPLLAANLTGGIGYAYSLPGAQPLTQVSVNGSAWSRFSPWETFPVTVTTGTAFGQDCTVTPCQMIAGGAIAPVQNVWKAAGTPRRAIVDNGKCNACHAMLGVGPTFHVGQRNDAPTCSFCHNPNQNKLGWSSGSSTFVHAIHASATRSADYGWTASCPTGSTWVAANARCENAATHEKVKAGFAAVEYPQSPAHCGACHVGGSETLAGVPLQDLLWTTAASGTMGATTGPAQSPDVVPGAAYGVRYSVAMGASGGGPVVTPAAPTTLVTSPITAACFSCHDRASARSHMTAMGGWLLRPRGTEAGGGPFDATLHVERCMGCHGDGAVFDAARMHR